MDHSMTTMGEGVDQSIEIGGMREMGRVHSNMGR